MGGNNRRRSNKAKTRKPRNPTYSGRGLFVEGGVLSDWTVYNSPPSRERTLKSENGSGNDNSRNRDAAVKSSKNALSSSREAKEGRGNEIRYVYPSADSVIGSDVVHSGKVKDNKLDWQHPNLLVDTKETQIVAFIDEGPNQEPQNEGCIYDCTTPLSLDAGQNKDSHEVDYAGDYSAGFSLDESSHRIGIL